MLVNVGVGVGHSGHWGLSQEPSVSVAIPVKLIVSIKDGGIIAETVLQPSGKTKSPATL